MRTESRRSSDAFRYCRLVAALGMVFPPIAAHAATFTVTSENELINAIGQINSCVSPSNVIDFQPAPFVLGLTSPLPAITCTDVTINGNGATLEPASAPAFFAYGGACGLSLSSVDAPTKVANLTVTGFSYGGGGTGICGWMDVTNSTVSGNDHGIYAGDSSIRNSVLQDNVYAGVVGDQLVVENNDVFNTSLSSSTGISVQDGSTLRDNHVYNHYTGIDAWAYETPIAIHGNNVHDNLDGIYAGGLVSIGSPLSTDRNFIYANDTGVYLSDQAQLINNYVGLDLNESANGNYTGVDIGATSGAGPLIQGNVISANVGNGVAMQYDGALRVIDNYIGTDSCDCGGLGNGSAGVSLEFTYGGAPDAILLDGNVIGSNGGPGVSVYGGGNVTIRNNKIGTNKEGTAALGNAGGVAVACSSAIKVQGNVISGNAGEGIYFGGVETSLVQSNKVGVGLDGASSIPNLADGITLAYDSCDLYGGYLSASSGKRATRAKAAVAGESNGNLLSVNIIANNSGNGIAVRQGVANTFDRNSIYANGSKNIDLDFYGGPLPNDAGDADTGPNERQNYPVASSVAQAGGLTTVTYTLDTIAGGYSIQAFANPAPGSPAGKTWIGTGSVAVGASPFSGTLTLSGAHDHISLIATNSATGDSSEFAPIASMVMAPASSITPTAVAFGNVSVGNASSGRSVLIKSTGTAPYQITALADSPMCYGGPICASGDFICSTNCSTSSAYAPGASCQITASFAPNYLGTQSTTIYVCDNTAESPRAVTLSGTGVTPPPFQLNPTSWDFGPVIVGHVSDAAIFNVFNPDSTDSEIQLTTAGDFFVGSNNCGSSLRARTGCAVEVFFAPHSQGALSGYLTVSGGSGVILLPERGAGKVLESPAGVTATLTGTGIQSAGLSLPSSIDFGTLVAGANGTQAVTLTNSGNAPLVFETLAASAPFVAAHDCPSVLAPGASCTVTLTFHAGAAGEFTGTLTVVTNAQGGSADVPITARVQSTAAPVIRVSPTAIGFGDRMFGSTSDSARVTITNVGGVEAALGSISASFEFLVVGTTCGITLAPSSSCFADVAMRPLGFGHRSGTLSIPSNAANSPALVDLNGTGCRPFNPAQNRSGDSSNCRP